LNGTSPYDEIIQKNKGKKLFEKLSSEIINSQIIFPRHFPEGAKDLLA
jgi:hypothetical protein